MGNTPLITTASSDGLRAAMRLFPTGVALLTSGSGGDTTGMTISSLMSVSLDPPLVLASVHQDSRAHAVLETTGEFSLSLLSAPQEELARLFASPDKPRGEQVAAYAAGALCTLSCSIQAVYPGGDHSLFLGRVLDIDFGTAEGPLLSHQGRLGDHRVLRPPEERCAVPDTTTTVRAIRGAIQVDDDTPDEILAATGELVSALLERNGIGQDDLVSIFFTTTPDLTSQFPALAAREAGLTDVPLMCASEIDVPDAMPRVIRLLAHTHTSRWKSEIEHVYLRGASTMRPDLITNGRN